MAETRSGPRHFFRLSLIEFLLRKSLKRGIILDAGCGDGSLSIRLARMGFEVYAVDASAQWCAIAQKRIKSVSLDKRIKVICSPLEKVALAPGSLDAILCGEVLEHIENDQEVLKTFQRLLKNEGVVILSVPLDNKKRDIWDTITGHVRLYNFGKLKESLESVGFKIEKTFSWGYPFAKLYHRLIFLKWAQKAQSEQEIVKPKHTLTKVGKNSIFSVIFSLIFFIDLFFTHPKEAIGIIIKAKRIR